MLKIPLKVFLVSGRNLKTYIIHLQQGKSLKLRMRQIFCDSYKSTVKDAETETNKTSEVKAQ